MARLMIAAPRSGSGKTTLTCGLLRLAAKKGLKVSSLKVGPDYIDPMFHRSVLNAESYNIDLFLCPQKQAMELAALADRADFCLMEGAMGYYDGVGGTTDTASAAHAARQTETPVLLVLEPGGSSLSLCALVKGFLEFQTPSCIRGLFLNRCSESLYKKLAPLLTQYTGLPVLGYLPKLPEASLPSRHLGLVCAEELPDLEARQDRVAEALETTCDWEGILTLAQSAPSLRQYLPQTKAKAAVCTIAYAMDEAFSFYYEESFLALKQAGARVIPFSPLRDSEIPPEADALYIGGGYPELHTRALSRNESMRASVARAAKAGMPMLAECGGFLYLQQQLEDPEGISLPMAGLTEGRGYKTPRLQRFGYALLTAKQDSLLFAKGQQIPIHEFHRWDTTQNGNDLEAQKPLGGAEWECGFCTPTLYTGFPHLYLYGLPESTERFVRAAEQYHQGKQL